MTTGVFVKSVMSPEERLERMAATRKRRYPPVPYRIETGPVNIVAYGPSLKETWRSLIHI